MCPGLSIANGVVATTAGNTPGSIATYTCDPGFNLSDDTPRTCENDGTWTGSDPVCQGEEL